MISLSGHGGLFRDAVAFESSMLKCESPLNNIHNTDFNKFSGPLNQICGDSFLGLLSVHYLVSTENTIKHNQHLNLDQQDQVGES